MILCLAERGYNNDVSALSSGHSEPDRPVTEIEFSDLDFGDEPPLASVGTPVYKGYWKSGKRTVAIKRVDGKIKEEEVSLFQRILF